MNTNTTPRWQGCSLDDMNDGLRSGMFSLAEAEAFCAAWNASGKHFYAAALRAGRIVLTDPPGQEERAYNRDLALRARNGQVGSGMRFRD